MCDVTKLFEVHKGMTVKIKVRNQSKIEIGKIVKILSGMDNPDGIEVVIDSGYAGNIIEIINSIEII